MIKIIEAEYLLMKKYIEENCGIYLEKGKEYLIESRLSDLAIQNGCDSFQEFHAKAKKDFGGKLRDQIVDAMTTNETLWFRDDSVWEYLKKILIPKIVNSVVETGKVRIWSAASSTGQEAYSLAMLIDEEAKSRGLSSIMSNVEILATDISSSALFLAKMGRYDSIAIKRGLPPDKKEKYFTKSGNVWCFDQDLKKRVQFKKFNLQNSFVSLGTFNLILCRYVMIYFSPLFKKEIFKKIAGALKPKGILLLGASETLRDFSDDFDISYYKNALINTKK